LLPSLIKERVGGSEGVVTYCLAVFTVGIALGSALAARASHGRPNLALVPIGALFIGLLALSAASLAHVIVPGASVIGPWRFAASPTGLAVAGTLCGMAIAGGLFVVPAFAAVQAWAPIERRARVIAAVNVLNAGYMLGGGAIVAGLQAAGVGLPVLFALLGLLSLAYVPIVLRVWGADILRDLPRMLGRLAEFR
jgi:acyl-[acyl-carrier-protein]-phospholipid O-acyltransferase/long-chain-fatty-acid--[acyl-carrier-protein] ligase